MAEVRRAGSRYRHPDGTEIKLTARVPGCENELWFSDVLKGPAGGPPRVVVAGVSLDGAWAKL